MKIVCDNCGAKYSIADEKVAGKVFKIRCKKCTHVIVVRGDQSAAGVDDGATAAGFDYGGDAIWHVVVEGDQQGPFSPQQLGEMMTAGQIDWEAYVWKEGFDGWKPARDIPELVTAISGEPASPDAGSEGPAFGADPFAGGGFAGGGFADEGAAFGATPSAAPEAARASAGASADLFAQADPASSPFGGGAEDDGVVASTPSPRVSQEQASMTGQRNENSVLFSLSNLQALATGGPSGSAPSSGGPAQPSAPAAKAGHATGEGSGLIDIRALANATAAAPSGGAAKTGDGVPDDLLSIGGGGLGSSLGAPVLAPAAPEPEKSNKGLIIGLAVGGAAIVALLTVLVVVLTKEPEPVATVTGAAPQAAGGEAANPNAATPAVPAAAGVAPAVPAVPAAAAAAAAAPAATPATPEPATETDDGEETSEGRRGRTTRRDRDRRSTSSSPMDSAPARATTRAEPSPMTSAMGGGNIDDLLDRALGGGGGMSTAMAAAPAAMSNLPEQPGRDDVARGLRSVAAQVESCGGGSAGVANAAITFASSGRVSNVNVTGVPPAVQSCVARGVRSARVPPFSRPTFNVNFPFRVR